MNRKNILVALLSIIYVLSTGFVTTLPEKKRVVVIDAGHGGKDSGALGLHSKEKDIVLAIALKVGHYIEQNLSDVSVIYTRNTDVFIPLDERAEIANKNNADLFISIHANSNTNTNASGTETFAVGLHKTKGNLEVAQKENSVIVFEEDYNVKYEGFDPNSPESYIIFSLMQNTFRGQSLQLASIVQDEFRDKAKRKDRGVKQAGFLVLWHTSMPSILIETGFVSNPDEEQYLISEQGQDYLASAIYRAVKNYLKETSLNDNEIANANTQTKSIEPVAVDPVEETNSTPAPKNNEEPANTSNIVSNVIFRVQVISSSKKIEQNTGIYENYTDIYQYEENNMFKYALGNYQSLDEAKKYQETIHSSYPDAFVVAFKDGKRISMKEALKNSKE